MNQQHYLEEIANLLETILEETEIISSHRKKIPQIELDLVMDNIRKLYDNYHKLNKLNQAPEEKAASPKPMQEQDLVQDPPEEKVNVEPPKMEEHLEKEPVKEEKKEKEVSVNTLPYQEEVPISPEQVQEEIRKRIAEEKRKEEEALRRKHQEEEAQKKNAHKPRYEIPRRPHDIPTTPSPEVEDSEHDHLSVADKYKSDEKTLNDKVEKANGVSIADRLQQNRITDLKAALGINDKFLFINDLFRGDSDKYNEAIEDLNELEGFQEASVHLNHLQQQYGWEKDSPVFQKLTDFLRRRYL